MTTAATIAALATKIVEAKAVPVDQWKIVRDEPVLILVEHMNAQYERDPKIRDRDWRAWCVGSWTDFNNGGWTWYGLCGRVTHVMALPVMPECVREKVGLNE